jgi:hypothetical protein
MPNLTTNDGVRVSADQLLKQYLLDTASNDMAVNGSVTPVEFLYTVPAGKRLDLERMMFYMEGATAFSGVKFADLTALTTGVTWTIAGSLVETWVDNIDIMTTMFDTEGRAVFSKVDRSLGGRWTFSKDTGKPIQLDAGQTVVCTINDDLSSLVHFRAKIAGLLVTL